MEFPNITDKMSRVQGKITRHGKNQENRKKSRKLETGEVGDGGAEGSSAIGETHT